MKIYTEEHLKIFYHLGKIDGFIGRQDDVNELIKNYPPIELPSDEEIGKLRDEHIPIDEENMWSERFYFTIGAKAMRDKIQGGNK